MAGENGVGTHTTHRNENVKQYLELDINSRVYKVFTAALNAPVGGTCGVTIYGYATPTSSQILSRVETSDIWTQTHQDEIDLLLA